MLPLMLSRFESGRVATCANYVRDHQRGDPGHDWLHIERVWNLAKRIAREEQRPSYMIELAALTHDLDDVKFTEQSGYQNLERALDRAQAPLVDIAQVKHIVSQLSWSKGAKQPDSIDARIVQDADRLDAIGAIGIARAFSYGGHKSRPFYERTSTVTQTGFVDVGPTTLAHFGEKLLLIRDHLHTDTARRIGSERHAFVVTYLQQFAAEVNGKR